MPFPPYYPPPSYPPTQDAPAEAEIAYLEDMKAGLEEELKNIRLRLDELVLMKKAEKPEDQGTRG